MTTPGPGNRFLRSDASGAENHAVRALAHALLGNFDASDADMESDRAAGLSGSRLALLEDLVHRAQAGEH